MNALALTVVRNEADLIESFVRHHLALVDLVVAVDIGSTDGTREILEALRREGLPLLVLDNPELGLTESELMTRAYRLAAPVFQPDLVYLLAPSDFIRCGDRNSLQADLARLAPGQVGLVPAVTYVPQGDPGAPMDDPLSALVHRFAEPSSMEYPLALRRDPALDDRLQLAALGGRPAADGHDLPAQALESTVLAQLPVRTLEQFTRQVVLGWQLHRARHADRPLAREAYAWHALLDRLLSGQSLEPALLPLAALAHAGPQSESATALQRLVRDPVCHGSTPPRYVALRQDMAEPLRRITSGLGWWPAVAPMLSTPADTPVDLSPVIDLCRGLTVQRAIVMGNRAWNEEFACALPEVSVHVPRDGQPDPAVDLLLVPETPADFVQELAGVCNPALIGRIALCPARPREPGALQQELALWARHGWEPDLLRTLSFRALSSYALGRGQALVLGPADPQRAARAQAVRDALCAMDGLPAWADPAPACLRHPMQALLLPAAPAAPAAAAPVVAPAQAAQPPLPVRPATLSVVSAAPAAPARRAPRSVLIAGAGRSGTSCLAGMFGPQTHHHARDLYKPQVSNPKGFFEAAHINDLNESILINSALVELGPEGTRELLRGFEPHQLWLARFPDSVQAHWNAEHRRQIAEAVAAAPFCLKDPRMSLTLPAWLEAAPDALVLSIHRPPAVTAASILRECQVATYLLDFRISMKDAFASWRQAYRRLVKAYRAGADVLFLRYDDLFDDARLARLEAAVGAPLQRQFAEKSLNRTVPDLKVDAECQTLHQVLDALSELSFQGDRARAHALIDRYLAAFPDTVAPAAVAQPA